MKKWRSSENATFNTLCTVTTYTVDFILHLMKDNYKYNHITLRNECICFADPGYSQTKEHKLYEPVPQDGFFNNLNHPDWGAVG